MHRGANARLDDLTWTRRAWNGAEAYAESKFLDVLIAFGVARRWPDVLSNALEPGWVATRMGGANAPDDLDQGRRTQVWLAVSDEPEARVTGKYFRYLRQRAPDPQTKFVRIAGPADRRMRQPFRRRAAGARGAGAPGVRAVRLSACAEPASDDVLLFSRFGSTAANRL